MVETARQRRTSTVPLNECAVEDCRNLAGLTRQQAAEAAGISRQFYCDIEAGRRGVRPDLARRLANVFRVHLATLLAPVCPDGCGCTEGKDTVKAAGGGGNCHTPGVDTETDQRTSTEQP